MNQYREYTLYQSPDPGKIVIPIDRTEIGKPHGLSIIYKPFGQIFHLYNITKQIRYLNKNLQSIPSIVGRLRV